MKTYYIVINQNLQGPYSAEQLATMPGFTPDVPVLAEGATEWIPASQVPELDMQYGVYTAKPRKRKFRAFLYITAIALLLGEIGAITYLLISHRNRPIEDFVGCYAMEDSTSGHNARLQCLELSLQDSTLTGKYTERTYQGKRLIKNDVSRLHMTEQRGDTLILQRVDSSAHNAIYAVLSHDKGTIHIGQCDNGTTEMLMNRTNSNEMAQKLKWENPDISISERTIKNNYIYYSEIEDTWWLGNFFNDWKEYNINVQWPDKSDADITNLQRNIIKRMLMSDNNDIDKAIDNFTDYFPSNSHYESNSTFTLAPSSFKHKIKDPGTQYDSYKLLTSSTVELNSKYSMFNGCVNYHYTNKDKTSTYAKCLRDETLVYDLLADREVNYDDIFVPGSDNEIHNLIKNSNDASRWKKHFADTSIGDTQYNDYVMLLNSIPKRNFSIGSNKVIFNYNINNTSVNVNLSKKQIEQYLTDYGKALMGNAS